MFKSREEERQRYITKNRERRKQEEQQYSEYVLCEAEIEREIRKGNDRQE